MLPVIDLNAADGRNDLDRLLACLQQTVFLDSAEAKAVSGIIAQVREEGDTAVVRYMRQWTDPAFDASRIVVTARQCHDALEALPTDLRRAIENAIEHVRAYQAHALPRPPATIEVDGCTMGLRYTPVDSAGLMVPGGTAVLFSTLIMLAVPALEAGVPADHIAVVHPPPTRREGEPYEDRGAAVLAVCALLGLRRVYRMGGAQAVAALAFGTERVPRVDLVAGPGNLYVQLAKAQVRGVVGTDSGFYGPSEIVIVADETADVRFVAADLLAQAEHDPGKCFLVTWSAGVLEAVLAALGEQLAERHRRDAIATGLEASSCAVLVADPREAVEVVNRLAAEHVTLAVADPESMAGSVRHAGEIFLGHATPVAAGDYFAGPSHCLPTGTTARFASGVGVDTFLKRTSTVHYARGMSQETAQAIALLADAEGLDGHAASARMRT